MTQFVGLFSNQTDAEQAMTALVDAGLEKMDLQMMVVTPGTAVAAALNLTGQTAHNFQNKVKNGGVLVIADLAKETLVTRTKTILEKQNSLIVVEGGV